MPLSERLNTIISLVPLERGVVDVGTDHAAVPIELAHLNRHRTIIGVEYNERPYYQAVQKIAKAQLTDVVEIRKGYGIDCLTPGEVEVAIIAGLGSATIEEILRRGQQVAKTLVQLILGPMDYPHQLRRYLLLNGFSIAKELLVHQFRWYEIIAAVPGYQAGVLFQPGGTDADLKEQLQNLFDQTFGVSKDVPLLTLLELTPLLSCGDPEQAAGFLQEKKDGVNRILNKMPDNAKTVQRRQVLEEKLQIIWELEEKLCGLKIS